MNPVLFCWLAAAIFFIFYFWLHVLYFRLFRPLNRFRVLKILFWVMAFLAAVWVGWFSPGFTAPPPLFLALHALLLFWFLFIGYCTFYSFADRSVSIRLHVELCRVGNQPHDMAQLISKYSPEGSSRRRLNQMVQAGLLRRVNSGDFQLTVKGIRTAKRISFAKKFLKLGLGG